MRSAPCSTSFDHPETTFSPALLLTDAPSADVGLFGALLLAASPSYLAARGHPRKIDELAEHDAPTDRDERPPSLVMKLDRLQMGHVENHRAVA